MVTPQDIIDVLKARVEALFPGEEVYTNRQPTDFKRPSTGIFLRKYSIDPGIAPALVGLAPVIELTAFAKADAYHYSDTGELGRRQLALTSLLLPGYLKVKDRAPKVTALKMEPGLDYASVVATFQYAVDRREFLEQDPAELMKLLHVRDGHGVHYYAGDGENEKE